VLDTSATKEGKNVLQQNKQQKQEHLGLEAKHKIIK
jgi:hypothetical protein